jgi:AAA ATPase domain
MSDRGFPNPFRPGAGHLPPYLAGRSGELDEMRQLLRQSTILSNILITGLRGVGKTVLLETFKPIALSRGWLWCSADLSASAGATEQTLATRMITDVSLVTSSMIRRETVQLELGFARTQRVISQPMNYDILREYYAKAPGLVSDKLKAVLEYVWSEMPQAAMAGIIFAYDEAQMLRDHHKDKEYPLSVLLDVFQYLQRRSIPFMLILSGLPTLLPKLVEARTYSERMFHSIFVNKLSDFHAKEAIVKPIEDNKCPITFSEQSVEHIVRLSAGYPYFIQFTCREVFDIWISKIPSGEVPDVPAREIMRKLDADFFQGRWALATDRQRELLQVASRLPNADQEFTVQEVVAASKGALVKTFTPSHVSQMLASLADAGLVYKNRYGKYTLAVPLLAQFVRRQTAEPINWQAP